MTGMHELAPLSGPGQYHVGTFNPGSNTRQVSRLRLANPNDVEVAAAHPRRASASTDSKHGVVGTSNGRVWDLTGDSGENWKRGSGELKEGYGG